MTSVRKRFLLLACAAGMLALVGCSPKPESVNPATKAANVRPTSGARAGVPASAPDPAIPGRPVAPGR